MALYLAGVAADADVTILSSLNRAGIAGDVGCCNAGAVEGEGEAEDEDDVAATVAVAAAVVAAFDADVDDNVCNCNSAEHGDNNSHPSGIATRGSVLAVRGEGGFKYGPYNPPSKLELSPNRADVSGFWSSPAVRGVQPL